MGRIQVQHGPQPAAGHDGDHQLAAGGSSQAMCPGKAWTSGTSWALPCGRRPRRRRGRRGCADSPCRPGRGPRPAGRPRPTRGRSRTSWPGRGSPRAGRRGWPGSPPDPSRRPRPPRSGAGPSRSRAIRSRSGSNVPRATFASRMPSLTAPPLCSCHVHSALPRGSAGPVLRPGGAGAQPQLRRPARNGSARVDVPVVSVGNLSTGGTGKTPLTLFLAEELEAAGWPSAVVSRGYGGRRDVDPMSVEAGSDPRQTGDEPLLMARRLGPDAWSWAVAAKAAALRALAQRPELRCLLLDDGFQHRALHRDLDLLLLDGVRRWGNGRMLPLGDLREPMASAAPRPRPRWSPAPPGCRTEGRRGVVGPHGSGGPVFWIDFILVRPAPLGHGRAPAHSLARPGPRFRLVWAGPSCRLLRGPARGRSVLDRHAITFPDHRGPTTADLRRLQDRARDRGCGWLVCTEKDAVKLSPSHAEGPGPAPPGGRAGRRRRREN